MRAKVAKRLRRAAGFHPSQPRNLVQGRVGGSIINHQHSSRAVYQNLKKVRQIH